MKKILYVASQNPGKVNEYKKLLSSVNCRLLLQPTSIEVIENGMSFRQNAIKKASEVSKLTNNYAIADDSGLCIEALNGRPGIYSSRYADNDENRIKRILKELKGQENRKAFFIANVSLCDPSGKLILDAEGACNGNILNKPRGNNGFGYDPIFEEKTTRLTFAEMNQEEKDSFSHRARALDKIIPELIKIFY